MTTLYQKKATIATPAAQVPDANQLALALGESSADDQTFSAASYQDAQGNLYAVCSTVAKPIFSQLAGQPLQAPDHAPNMDVSAASRAQAVLQINGGIAAPGVIAVILGGSTETAPGHIAALGLERMQLTVETV